MKTFHPIVSTAYYVSIIGLTMFSNSPVILALSLLGSLVYVYLFKKEDASASIGPLIIMSISICLIGTLINGLFTHNGATVLFYIGPNRITLEAFVFGFVMSIIIVSVISWFMSFGIVMTSDKLITVFGRLAPVLGLTVSMIFRFVPLLRERYKDIEIGQASMGRSSTEVHGIMNKIRQKAKEISILISWSLEASIESADSMAARGYGLPGRTSYRIFKFDGRDAAMLCLILGLAIGTAVLYGFGAGRMSYYPEIVYVNDEVLGLDRICCVLFAVLAFLPSVHELYEEALWKKSA